METETNTVCPCDSDDARAAMDYLRRWPIIVSPVAESHFSIRILRCGGCGTPYLKIFSETIDWDGGNDPTRSCYYKLTEDELSKLILAGEALDEHYLSEMGSWGSRDVIYSDWPAIGDKEYGRYRGTIIGEIHD